MNRSILLAAVAVATIAAPASAYAQSYYARERLEMGNGSAGGVPTPTPNPNPTPAPAPDPVTPVSCDATKSQQKWSSLPDVGPNGSNFVILGNDGQDRTGATARKLCQDYATSTGKPGVCSVNYQVFYFAGPTNLVSLSSTFATNYSFSCRAQ